MIDTAKEAAVNGMVAALVGLATVTNISYTEAAKQLIGELVERGTANKITAETLVALVEIVDVIPVPPSEEQKLYQEKLLGVAFEFAARLDLYIDKAKKAL